MLYIPYLPYIPNIPYFPNMPYQTDHTHHTYPTYHTTPPPHLRGGRGQYHTPTTPQGGRGKISIWDPSHGGEGGWQGLVHKLTNKQHLPHLSFLPLTLFPDPFEITPSWPQLQHGPATLTSPDPTARQLKRAPVHRHHRCCCRWGQASADSGFPSVPAPRPGRLGATASRWIPFFWGQGTGTDPGEIYRWGSSNQHQADGNHQAVGNYHF